MNSKRTIGRTCLGLLVVGGPLLAGCTHRTVIVDRDNDRPRQEVRTETVYVETAPPPVRAESRPAPRPGYVWVDGYYRHNGRNYVWVPGRWDRAPRAEARWTPGRWDRDDRGYFWVEGRWE